ncbi:hypothetical protein MINTMi198_17680 [Mycobacterium intracellulare M.i.198]|nr:hypothetical protein MINTMi198_17680 [Mycobacterium intracellulare M.i.198]
MSNIGVRFTRHNGSTFVQEMLSAEDARQYLGRGHDLPGEIVRRAHESGAWLPATRGIGPEEAKIRAQTRVGLSGLADRDPYESPWYSSGEGSYDPAQDKDPCPYNGKRHKAT